MPCPRYLRVPVVQFYLDNSHCHRAIPTLSREHISTCIIRSHGQRYSHGHTHKAPFSTSRSHHLASAREPTYYEILDVAVTATPSEIKKQFYSLSLRHHPDRNRNDPSASSRFAKISSAYQTLSNATKRATYDRDHGIHSFSSTSTHSTANPGQNPMGSHSSYSHGGASYFGSRPASGLSKRRGTFRGPPPSFYAHGGYGNRKAPRGDASAGAGSGSGSGTGKEDDWTSFIDRNPVSHFNARGHYRTQTAEDARRQERRSRQAHADINDRFIGNRSDSVVRFIAVFSILLAAGGLSGMRLPSSDIDKSAKGKSNSRVKDG
ncbi:DnaJ domain-containing protein [Aspergillus spectabilis]